MEDDDWQEDEQVSLSESDHSGTDEYQNFQNELPLDKVLSQHPLFKFKDDDILLVFIKPLETLIKASPNSHTLNTIKDQLKNCLHQEIFGDKDAAQLKAEFQNLNLTHKTICGKLIPINDIYFRCLDCDIHENPAFISLLCTRCFEKSNHDGHRLIIVKKENNSSATCDCGDADVFNPEGFCPDHQPREVDVEDLLKKFPKIIFEKCQSTLKKAFYGVVSAYEIGQKTSNDTIKTAVMAFAEKSMEALLLFCVFCYSEINEAFLPIFGILLKGCFDDKHNILWHDCDDLKAENRLEDIDISDAHKCKCTILGNLLRLGNVMETEGQSKLHKILIECAKEHKFKEFLLLEFTKYLHFLYSQEYNNDEYEDNVNSRLLNMKTQLYSRDALLLQVLDTGHFQNLLSVMRRVVHSASQANHEVYHIMADLRSAILYFLNPKYQCSGRLIKNSDLMLDLLDVLMNFQIKFLYEGKIHIGLYEHKVEYRSINCGLMIEKVISQTLESGIKLICEYPVNEKIPLAKNFGSKWHENFLISREVLDDEMRNGFVTFHTGLERIFCYFIRNYTHETSLPDLEKFFKEVLPDVKPSEVAEKVLEGTLRTLGMVRYLHMVHNFKTGQLWYVYYFFNNVFFEMDVVSAQLMTMMINPDNLFDVFVKNFFSYSTDLQDFFKNPTIINTGDYFKQRLSVLEDFLNFLIYLMHDEICGLNLELKDAHSFHENVKVDSRYKRIVEKVLINLLLGHYWTDLPHLKDVLKDVMKEQHEVDEIIPKITILDEKNHKIRLKDQYEQELDPYMFYRAPYIQRDILNNFGSKQKKNEKSDLISGKFYTDLPQYLKVIQKNIYQSHLPNFLRLFLSKFIKETSPLVRPALKLVLLNLQVVSESLSSVSSANELLKKRVQENYFDSEFSNTLHEILQKEGLKDCELIIEKIKDLIKTLMTKMHQRQTVETETMQVEEIEDQEARKKKLAKEKMQKMKEEFVKKRATFATKNTDLISQSTECEESKTESSQVFDHTLTCQYCLDKINDQTEEHGAPIYVAFTNNFYDTEQQSTFKEQDYSTLTKSNWWPVISSCHHSYHKKCFDSLYKNSMSPQETSKKLLSNKYETYCSLCKGLCNGFLCMNESTTFTPHVKEVSEEEKEKYSELYSSFAVKPKQILLDLRKRMTKLCPSTMEEEAAEEPWLTEEVFKRAYAYYLESIHLHTQSDALEKFFDVFPHFFRGYGDHLKEIEKEETNIPSFFERVWKNNNVQTAESLLQYQAEPLINEIYFEILSEFLTRGPEGKTESVIINKQVAVLLDYLVFKIVQLACFEKGDKPLKPDDLLSFYRNSQLLKDIVITELVFPIQKILTACCLNICTILKKPIPNELYNLLCNPGYDTEYLDKLLQLTGVEYSFEKMLEKSLSELGNQTKDILAPINIMLEAKTADKKTIRPRVVKLAPRTIQLPQNFAEFNTQYYKQKCKLCNDFSKHLMTSICLICGDVMCQAYCDPTNKVFGNLNRHASKYHMGSGLFLDLQHLSKTVISAPLNAIYSGKNVYIDKFGQAIQVFLHERRNILYSLDFKKFTLNEEFTHYLNDITNHHSMGKEVFKVSKTSHYLYNNGNL